MKKSVSIASFIVFALTLFMPALASASTGKFWQCVTYAREVSGIQIRGNAETWWGQAAGRYDRGHTPREGSVLAMPGYGKMSMGHVAMVSKVIGDREILLTHANWSRRGQVERNVRAIDVSANGDWSRVKIWFAGNGDLGTSSYPASGFIYADKAFTPAQPQPRDRFQLGNDVLQMASLEMTSQNAGGTALLR